jgi:hypothetical protein
MSNSRTTGSAENPEAHVPRTVLSDEPRRTPRKFAVTARWLDRLNPDAAPSLREGLAERLTVVGLGIPGALRRTLGTANQIEGELSVTRRVTSRVTQ